MVLIGIGGDRDGTIALAERLGLRVGRDVVFLERLSADLPAGYHGATAFITLSRGESFSFLVLESMNCGLPVIATSFGGVVEVVGDAAIVVDPRQPADALRAIKAVTSDHALRAELSEKALNRGRLFAWRRTAELTVEIYRDVLARWRGARHVSG